MQHELSGSIARALPDAVLSIDRASVILFANDAAVRLFGYARESFVGRTLSDTIIPPDLAPQHARGMATFAATGHGPVIGRRIEITARDAEGRRFPIELTVFLDPERRGEVFHATIRDITERAGREAESKAERERMRQFLDAAADGWWDCRVGGATQFGDGVGALLPGWSDAMASSAPSELPLIHAEDRARVADAWAAHLEGVTGRYECTHRVLEADGSSVRWIRQSGRAVEFDIGRPTRIVGTFTDVTELQSAEERLRSAQRLEMLGLLAGGFAHDLNNLLAAIRGQAALAASEPGVTTPILESLESIQLATTKAKMLSTNMLSLGKPAVEDFRSVAVRPLIEETLLIARPGLPKSIRLVVELDALDGAEVEMDASAFQQAVLNLAINARDAMPQGGTLRVDGTVLDDEAGGRVRVQFEDTGTGIAPEVLPRIFDPFFTTKPKGVGTGLGLAVVARAVHAARGSVRVESERGHGARFILDLPLARRAVRPAMGAATGASRPCRVVVAEDHPLLRPLFADALRAMGHDVRETGDGAEAVQLSISDAWTADLVVLDVLLPSMDGLRAHRRIESLLGRSLPAVFISGEPESVLPADAPASMELLAKPFEIMQLQSAIDRVMLAAAAR
jgi:PAS domain S-box-containing protein